MQYIFSRQLTLLYIFYFNIMVFNSELRVILFSTIFSPRISSWSSRQKQKFKKFEDQSLQILLQSFCISGITCTLYTVMYTYFVGTVILGIDTLIISQCLLWKLCKIVKSEYSSYLWSCD